MPELPELTVFAANLTKAVVGKEIVGASFDGKKRVNVAPEEFSRAVVAAKITQVERVGKQLLFTLSNGNTILVHLMLNGGFVLTTAQAVARVPAQIFSLTFADGSALALTDPKAMASAALNSKKLPKAPDGLKVTADYLKEAFQRQPGKQIKAFLIDQELIAGIGNAYSDEILWLARISPKSTVGKLPDDAIDALVAAIPAVLNEAIAEIRQRRPSAVAGEIRDFLKVHGPRLKKSPTGAPIIKEQVQSKTTYYTEEQKLYR